MKKTLLIASLLVLQGCSMKSQVITVNETPAFSPKPVISNQAALVKVEDRRALSERVLGYRIMKQTDESSLMMDQTLSDVLSKRMEHTLSSLGFGGEDMAVATRVKLVVDTFNYQCKSGLMTECSLKMKMTIEVMDDNSSFKKPYIKTETRSVAASPVKEYNEKWVNQALDQLWQVMFEDQDLLKRLAKPANQAI